MVLSPKINSSVFYLMDFVLFGVQLVWRAYYTRKELFPSRTKGIVSFIWKLTLVYWQFVALCATNTIGREGSHWPWKFI